MEFSPCCENQRKGLSLNERSTEALCRAVICTTLLISFYTDQTHLLPGLNL